MGTAKINTNRDFINFNGGTIRVLPPINHTYHTFHVTKNRDAFNDAYMDTLTNFKTYSKENRGKYLDDVTEFLEIDLDISDRAFFDSLLSMPFEEIMTNLKSHVLYKNEQRR